MAERRRRNDLATAHAHALGRIAKLRVRCAMLTYACREAEALLTIEPPRYGREHTLAVLGMLRAALAGSKHHG
jgi:hypothetical protein